jgi:type VI protein secretion system component VasK
MARHRYLFKSIARSLEKLQFAEQLYRVKPLSSLHFFIVFHHLRSVLHSQLQKVAQIYLLPLLAGQIEKMIAKGVKKEFQYALLKGLLAFNGMGSESRYSVELASAYVLKRRFPDRWKMRQQLLTYLKIALEKPLILFPLEASSIERSLEIMPPFNVLKSAYGLLILRAEVMGLPPLFFNQLIPNFNSIFLTNSPLLNVSGFYSSQGFHHVFLKYHLSAIRSILQDKWLIHMNVNSHPYSLKQIKQQIQRMYQMRYEKVWMNALKNIHVKTFVDFNEAINTLKILSHDDSPLKSLFNQVHENTSFLTDIKQQKGNPLVILNQYIPSNRGILSTDSVREAVKPLCDLLEKLNRANDPRLAAFVWVRDWFRHLELHPFEALHAMGQEAPKPIKRLCHELVEQVWQFIIGHAKSHMQQVWMNEVWREYHRKLQGRFPIDPNAKVQMSTRTFDHFFGGQGTLTRYFDRYIKPFVHQAHSDGIMNKKMGLDLHLSKTVLRLFKKSLWIKCHYFSSDRRKPLLHFYIEPVMLDSRVSDLNTHLGHLHFSYHHGPPERFLVQWPFLQENMISSMSMKSFDRHRYGYLKTGAWSLFKWLEQGTLRHTNIPNRYQWLINVHGYHAAYELIDIDDLRILTLTDLKNFQVPKHLFAFKH